ncbi:MAG: hypothetical protein AB2A00_14020 [Myxococcota bacterium]
MEVDLTSELLVAALSKGPVEATLRGGSMTPCIPHLSRVRLQRPPARLVPGHVVLARVVHRLVVHRVVAVEAHALLLQGDSLPSPDGWVPRAEVLGLATHVTWRGRTRPLEPRESGVWRLAGSMWAHARRALRR